MAISSILPNEIGMGRTQTFSDSAGTVSSASAVSWGAIIAGAAAAAALSLILFMLGIGLGLSSVSPWVHEGIGAKTLGVSTILWVTFTQLVASGMGGYLAGRLRTKWLAVHTDEVYFRDTAHGFLAWAVASLTTAALLTSVIGSMIGGGVKAGAAVAGSAATTAAAATAGAAAAAPDKADSTSDNGPMGYFVDSLFRRDAATPGSASTSGVVVEQSTAPSPPEVARIFLYNIRSGSLPAEDVRYIGQVVAQRIGVTQPEAEKRVIDTYARLQAKLREAEVAARDAADKARKASAYAALWLFVSLLVGAFVGSWAALFGGRQRDL